MDSIYSVVCGISYGVFYFEGMGMELFVVDVYCNNDINGEEW